MSVQLENGLTEYCHLVIVPVCPERVSNPLVLPEQIVVPPATVPPTDAGSVSLSSGRIEKPRWRPSIQRASGRHGIRASEDALFC